MFFASLVGKHWFSLEKPNVLEFCPAATGSSLMNLIETLRDMLRVQSRLADYGLNDFDNVIKVM